MFWLGGFVWKIAIIGALLGLMVFAAIILVALFSQMAQAQTLKGQVPAHITSEFGVALCKEPEDILRLSQIVGQKDHEAFEKLMIYLIITSRKCTILKPELRSSWNRSIWITAARSACVRVLRMDHARRGHSRPTTLNQGLGAARIGEARYGEAGRGAARRGRELPKDPRGEELRGFFVCSKSLARERRGFLGGRQ